MTQAQDRRAQGTHRVPLETLVEICGNEPGIPAFEAEALDVSAQGMHLRTAYLPDEGAPLVCRFEDHGREIVVEGVVAWRKESSKGGDFGVAFTALDSRSVDALRALVKTSDPDEAKGKDDAPSGARVRLHIEGLGSPMKARIRAGSTQKIQVGSSLEFLKVGRKLDVEDMDAGGRRAALIDGVEVVVDPRTSVPQLVVALRYEGATEDTPQPTVTDLDAQPVRPQSLRLAPEAVTVARAHDDDAAGEPAPSGDVPEARADDEHDDAHDDEADEDEDELDAAVPATTRAARRLGHAAENAGSAARDASVAAARWGSDTFGKLWSGASAKFAALRAQKSAPAMRRTTAKPVESPSALDQKRLRPQSSGKNADSAPPVAMPARPSRKRAAVVVGLAVVAASAGAVALRPSKVASKSAAPEATVAAASTAAGDAPVSAPTVTALATGVVPLPGSTAAGPAPLATEALSAAAPGGPVTANVPLFGPTPLATMEPAPLGPPPSAEAKGVEQAELTAAKAAAPPPAGDEEFPDPIEHVDGASSKHGADAKGSDAKDERPEDVPAWGKGKMHTPTVHRLRLDGPGTALHGVSDATGFTVLVPGRKLMEKGDALIKRDPRIGRARTTNTPGGAQLRITFKDGLPAYRVRLRRDYVEVLISSPEETPAKKDGKEAKDAKVTSKAVSKSDVASKSIPAKH
ncbi:MAG TPA: PilZ domain-containing protein [Polyangiaceae bacterium]|nr:PilZ domain-containing protein [Polyangiaceae bacterium]